MEISIVTVISILKVYKDKLHVFLNITLLFRGLMWKQLGVQFALQRRQCQENMDSLVSIKDKSLHSLWSYHILRANGGLKNHLGARPIQGIPKMPHERTESSVLCPYPRHMW